ncbi:MAG: hypothetical protein OWU33_02215 [Firmicutes bacterium]|nr:hypothetical protein [Bacillota bacterium]
MSTITSRCGSVTVMGLGLAVIGLWVAWLVNVMGQIWWQHQMLESALINAILAMSAAHTVSTTILTNLLDQNLHGQSVVVESLVTSNGHILSAVVRMPVRIAPWPRWLGPPPLVVIAAA